MDPLIQALIAQAMKQDDGSAAMEQELGMAQALGPEGMAKFIGSNTLGERGALAKQGMQGELGMLGDKLSAAREFAQPVGKNYGTVGGNIGGGIGDILRSFVGQRRIADLEGQQGAALQRGVGAQGALLNQMDSSNLGVANARQEAMRKFLERMQPPKQQPMSDASLLEPLTLGG